MYTRIPSQVEPGWIPRRRYRVVEGYGCVLRGETAWALTADRGTEDSRLHDDGERPKHIVVYDVMQQGYEYDLVARPGRGFDSRFEPSLTPEQMLRLGVFGGKYMTDCRDEFPDGWYAHAKLYHEEHLPELNYFGVNASLPLSEWRRRGWIHPDDPRGWFQWYCRYWMGRRMPGEDEWHIGRWLSFRRHAGQVQRNCPPRAEDCRPKQRQALMNWAYDSRKL